MSKGLMRASLIIGCMMIAAGVVGSCATGCTYDVTVPQPVVTVNCLELVFGNSHAVDCPPADAGDGG